MRHLVVSLALLAGCASAPLSAMVADSFGDLRLSVGIAPGFSEDKIDDSRFNGVKDPSHDVKISQTQRPGIDIEPGVYLAGPLGEGYGLVFGPSFVFRQVGSKFSASSDTGTDNGAGTGNVLANDQGTISARMTGAKFAVGPYWSIGILRLELTPYVGVGSISAKYEENRSYANNPNALFATQTGSATYREHGSYFQYGATIGLYLHALHLPLLGGMVGFDGTRSRIKTSQHGPIDAGTHTVKSQGLLAAASVGWDF